MNGPAPTPPAATDSRARSTTKQIRGSALLMVGRGISLGLNFAVQVLIVRYLSKLDYGAFAYGLQVMHLVSRMSLFGMDRVAARFVATYDEQRDAPRLLGSIVLMILTIFCLGVGAIVTVTGFQVFIGNTLVSSPKSLTLLLALILLAPVEALDSLLQSLFAAFSKARLIFFRRYVVGPSLKLAAVLLVIASTGDVVQLALTYVTAGFVGFLIGATLLFRVFRERGLLAQLRFRRLVFPAGKIYAFGVPMMLSDLTLQLRSTLIVMLLEFFHGSGGVADFRAVLPAARLNRVVLNSFGHMFMPAVARLLARNESREINELFWRSTVWVTVLSFPAFALTFAFAEPVTVLLFGERYAGSATILALLSLGMFLSASVGLNSLVLKGSGKTGRVVFTDVSTVVVMVTANLLLIPPYGAFGGACGFCLTALFQTLMYQVGTHRSVGIELIPWKYVHVYAAAAICVAVLTLVQKLWDPHIAICIVLVGIAWLLLLMTGRRQLDVEQTFPELLRLPLVRGLLVPADRD